MLKDKTQKQKLWKNFRWKKGEGEIKGRFIFSFLAPPSRARKHFSP